MIIPKNLLIVRTDRIGDVILSLPLSEIIKKHFPKCRVTFLVKNYTQPIVAEHQFIDEVITLPEVEGKINFRKIIQQLKEKNFDTCLVVHSRFNIALILFLAGIKWRIGTGYRWYSFLFNKKIFEHRKKSQKHELEYNLNMLSALNISEKIDFTNIDFNLSIDKSSEKKVNSLLSESNLLSKKIVIIHPGSSGSSVDLPMSKFIELTKLIKNKDCNIILTGSKSEFDLCEQLRISENIFNFAGKCELSELIALINKAEIFISNSTGPIHIAAALKKNVVGFYPKIKECSAQRWGPFTSKRMIYSPTIDCNNCDREQCERLDCMNSIDMNKVFFNLEQFLEQKK